MTNMKKMHFYRRTTGTGNFFPALALLVCMAFCDADGTAGHSGADAPQDGMAAGRNPQKSRTMNNMIKITAGSATFTATLPDNAAAAAFRALLPLTLKMEDVNGNEKFYRLSTPLPAAVANPGTVREGDLMLWGSKGLVLFYKTFSTSYGYTRLGSVDNPSGLAAALGSGDVEVTFELKQDERNNAENGKQCSGNGPSGQVKEP